MSILVTKKVLLKFAEELKAYDLTQESDEFIQAIKRDEKWLNEIAWSRGKFGFTSILYQGENSKNFYVIKSRSGAFYAI